MKRPIHVPGDAGPRRSLAERDQELAAMVDAGLSRGEIARRLGIHRNRLSSRLRDCSTRLGRDLEPPSSDLDARLLKEPQCGRCKLRGHSTENCDLGSVDTYARRPWDHIRGC